MFQNPASYTDRLGLQVDLVLNTSANTLTAVDRDTGQSLSMQAFTGGQVLGDGTIVQPNTSPYLAAPKGTYLITDNPNFRVEYPDWYGLLKNDSRIDDYFDDNGKDRSGARLHYGSTSYGCATVTAKEQWSQLDKLLKSTTTQQTQFIKGPHFWNPAGNITQYGTLTVK